MERRTWTASSGADQGGNFGRETLVWGELFQFFLSFPSFFLFLPFSFDFFLVGAFPCPPRGSAPVLLGGGLYLFEIIIGDY